MGTTTQLFNVYARRRGDSRMRLVRTRVPFESLISVYEQLERDGYCDRAALPASLGVL